MAGNGKNKRTSAGVREKLLSKTPLTIRFSKEESNRLKELPVLALNAFKENKGNISHWKAVIFRLNVTLLLTDKHFKELEAVTHLKLAIEVLLLVFYGNRDSGVWTMSDKEISILDYALELSNDVQDMCSRREMLDAYKATEASLKLQYGI